MAPIILKTRDSMKLLLPLFLVVGVAGVLCPHHASAQAYGRDFASAKLLFIDHGHPNGFDTLNVTNGLEIAYRRNLSPYLSLAVPLKFGQANVQDDLNNRNFFSIDGLLRLQYYEPNNILVPYLIGGVGYVMESGGENNSQIPIGGGLDIKVGRSSYINLQGEYRISSVDNRDNLQAGLGLIYRLGDKKADTDQDGIPDEADECPEAPGSLANAGCPDTDGDGIIDPDDACPGAAGPADNQGCPDQDGDGVLDKDDQCPEVAGDPDFQGCPDSDGDGIPDKSDPCPDMAGNLNGCPDQDNDGIADPDDDCPEEGGIAAFNGCPDPDRDGDGFDNAVDACPDQPGTANGCPDQDGDSVADSEDSCPDQAGPVSNKGCPEIREEDREVLNVAMRAVRFASGRARLLPESYDVLDQIVAIMDRYPAYKLTIAGHTDSAGQEQTNQILSEDRARACFQYLLANGVEASRMSYVGYGESSPIADNSTAEGRRLNRRVEFELMIQ